MKQKSLKRGKLGFTLTELLAVIAVIVILIGLGIPSFLALRRTIKIAEYDDIAREIYVAAQNQLTSLSANGMDQATADTLKAGSGMVNEPSDAGAEPFNLPDYRYDTQGGTAMAVLLPLGSVADDVRSNGFYVIEYNVATNMVYGVFYSEKQFDYSTVSTMENFRTSRDVRKGPMVGYYGGSAVARDPLTRCAVPQLEIINENVLQLNILNVPSDVTIKVSVSDGTTVVEVPSASIGADVPHNARTVLLDSMESGKHFHELFSSLTPGNDLTITVTYEKDGLLPSSASISANSLFATREPGNGTKDDGTEDAVTIAWARHLQNLEPTVSMLNGPIITRARQTDHIQWEDGFDPFVSIENSSLTRYEGGNLEIRDLRGANGLFATTTDMSLSGIRLVNPAITADENNLSAPVGALVGTITGTPEKKAEIASCAVYYSKLNNDNTVNYNAYADCVVDGKNAVTGGLVGSAEHVNVTNSFAALPRINAEQGGTLIGSASNCAIENSYANCDNLPDNPNFYYFLGGNGNTVKHCYAVGSVENTTDGAFAAPDNTATDSYYAVSHTDWQTDPFTDLSATEFFYTANGNAWQKTNQEGLNAVFDGKESWSVISGPLSHPYRQYLDGRAYPYPAISIAGGTLLDHHGSWPTGDGTVDLKITMRLLNNKDAGYASFAGQVVVTDLTHSSDPENPVVLFDSSKDYQTEGDEIVKVTPGTKVKIEVKDLPDSGYTYVNTIILDQTWEAPDDLTAEYSIIVVDGYSVDKDTEVIVNFQQSDFTLHCMEPTGDNDKPLTGATYSVDIPGKTLGPGDSEMVATGSSITIRPSLPSGQKVGVVWYTTGTGGTEDTSTRHTLIPNSDGSYTFEMPSQETWIHVQYTSSVAQFTVNYYVMDADKGNYKDTPTRTANMEYGIGTVISQEMIEALAENSGYLQTISGVEVLFLDKAQESTVSRSGSAIPLPYTTVDSDKGQTFIVNIYIARKESQLILVAGENISSVAFDGESASPNQVTQTVRYGQRVTAVANVVPGQDFTFWEPSDSRFRASSSTRYSFEAPYYDLTLKASAAKGYYLVTLNLLENEESWLAKSASRQADPVSITLVNSLDGTEYPMNSLTEDTNSYIMQQIVPSIPELNAGYHIKVSYASGASEDYCDSSGNQVLLTVRDRAVERNVYFFTVTYHANAESYLGEVPKGGTYLQFHQLTVSGNTGLLRNDLMYFNGWRDADAGSISTQILQGGDPYTVTRRTDFFANWVGSLQVTYHPNGATGGELPSDHLTYQPGDTVNVKWGSLTRRGYQFLGWATDQNATEPDYAQGATTSFNFGASPAHLYAVWEQEEYTLQFLKSDGTPLVGDAYTVSAHYGDQFAAPSYPKEDLGTDELFLGWATTRGGDVVYRPGNQITATGDQDFYARIVKQTVTLTYHYWPDGPDGAEKTERIQVGKGIPGYLSTGVDGVEVTAWSTQKNGGGTFYLCEEGSDRSLESVAFTESTDLYAVTGNVYNYNRERWYPTLYEAVKGKDSNTASGDTLIVYRDTEETNRISFNKSLYVLANGNRTVKWKSVSGNQSGEFIGCMYLKNCEVTFGRSDIANLSMEGGSLTFDAAKLSRVMALDTGAVFRMYDGVTLTNGYLSRDNTDYNGTGVPKNSVGGGVYAGLGSEFYMNGGTISYCTARRGGGVYLYGNKDNGTGSKMYMGAMEHPTAYSATATYYDEVIDENGIRYYQNASDVTLLNYREKFVATGNPEICYNTATNPYPYYSNPDSSKDNFSHADGGGGVLMLDLPDGNLALYKGAIRNNTASANGGGILTDAGANGDKLRIYEVDISHNFAGGYGGGIFQWQGTVYVYNSTLRQNYAKEDGGGIYLHHYGNETSNVEFYFGDIADNEAGQDGGGVYVEDGLKMQITEGVLRNNKAGASGGGVYLAGQNSDLYLSGGAIYDNVANYQNTSAETPEKPNDVCLIGGSVITVEEKKNGLHLSQNNPGQVSRQVAVDGYINKIALNAGTTIVEYQKASDFKPEDADLFIYVPNARDAATHSFVVTPTTQNNNLVPPLILSSGTPERTLEFYKNDGTDTVKPQQTTVGATVTFPTFIREGYYLAGWAHSPDAYEEDYLAYYDDNTKQWYTKYEEGHWTGEIPQPTYTVTALYEQKFYAMWKPYVVRYDLGSAGVEIPPLADGVGPTVTIRGPDKNFYTDADGVTYRFRGWSTDENATDANPDYDENQTITLTDHSLHLYAVWQASVVKITFDFNGGGGIDIGGTQLVASINRGESKLIKDFNIEITRVGYTFAGWSKNPDGLTIDYTADDVIQTGPDTPDMTLYAVWEPTPTDTGGDTGDTGQSGGGTDQSGENTDQSGENTNPSEETTDPPVENPDPAGST